MTLQTAPLGSLKGYCSTDFWIQAGFKLERELQSRGFGLGRLSLKPFKLCASMGRVCIYISIYTNINVCEEQIFLYRLSIDILREGEGDTNTRAHTHNHTQPHTTTHNHTQPHTHTHAHTRAYTHTHPRTLTEHTTNHLRP